VARRILDRLVPTAIVAAVVGVLFSQTRHYAMLGFDSYPIIVTSRVRSLADLIGNFTEKLMDGRYPSDFYRPLLNCSFSLDHAVWGLNPFGYQLTNALLLAVCGGAIWLMLRRMLGRATWIGPLTGLLVFLLSPVHWEVLPVPARRAELLCVAFMAIALTVQLAPRALASRRPPVWPAVMTLLAIASKETAFVLPVLLGVAVLLHSERKSFRERLMHAATSAIPPVVAAGLMLLVRVLVLGGLGGHGSYSLKAVLFIWRAIRHLLLPQPMMQTRSAYGFLILLIAVLALAVGLTVARASAETRRRVASYLRVAALAATWVVLLALIYAVGQLDAWYSLIPLAGWALLAGALMEGLLILGEDDDRIIRPVTVVSLVLLTVAVVWQCSYSPVFRGYDEWARGTTASQNYLEETHARIANAAPGTIVVSPHLPYSVKPIGVQRFWGVAVLADYTVQAWADLAFEDLNVRVHVAKADAPEPGPDEIVLQIPGYSYVY
jgi:hypothetical protein